MPFNIIKLRKGLFSVINSITGHNFSPKGIPLARAKRQMRALYLHAKDLDGYGIIDSIKNIFSSSSKYNNVSTKTLKDYGSKKIVQLVATREKIQKILSVAMDMISFVEGGLSNKTKKMGYDDLFHIRLYAKMDDGKLLLIEKNEVIYIKPTDKVKGEPLPINYKSGSLTLSELMANGQKYMGGKFFTYDAFDNNCASFIIGVLKGNKLWSDADTKFLAQDVSSLKKSLPATSAVSNFVTSLGAVVSRAIGRGVSGGAITAAQPPPSPPRDRKHLNKSHYEDVRMYGPVTRAEVEDEMRRLRIDLDNINAVPNTTGEAWIRANPGIFFAEGPASRQFYHISYNGLTRNQIDAITLFFRGHSPKHIVEPIENQQQEIEDDMAVEDPFAIHDIVVPPNPDNQNVDLFADLLHNVLDLEGDGMFGGAMPDDDKENLVYKAMSDADLHKYFPHAKVLKYSELPRETLPEEFLKVGEVVYILYESSPNSGHWVSLARGPDAFYYMDSYGNAPDVPLTWSDAAVRKALGEEYPTLTKMFSLSKYPVYYNDFDYQSKKDKEVATCGRWATAFLIHFKKYGGNLKSFHQTIMKGQDKADLPLDKYISTIIKK